jgi:hypothetical protein
LITFFPKAPKWNTRLSTSSPSGSTSSTFSVNHWWEHQSWFKTGYVINSYLSPQRKPSGPVLELTLPGPTRQGRRLNSSPTGPERHCRRWCRRVTGPNFTRRIEQTARWSGGRAPEWSVAF